MVCTSTREGVECFFMTKKGCEFNGGTCHTVVEQCDGCQKVNDFATGKYCLSFPDPSIKWRTGICNMATHAKAEGKKANGKINPLKASKRKAH